MNQPLNFQQVILKLHDFWAGQGCVIWEPYNVQVGAGTGNPATTLRVLGPEPWRVAYVEPSVRPDDGRYGENPNRMQKYYQYQVILKPDPGNPQELYLQSLEALGISQREHDIRFVEDNWESPALGAWGLGWEVWLDGQEITQFTYFQQAGGMELNPVSVEITYGVERIVLALQEKNSAWDIAWLHELTYADVILQEEIEHCRYYFDIADISALQQIYDVYERESARALEEEAVISSYDYVLKCSHLFNVLDTRGAIGVTERASYFRRMRDMTRYVAQAYLAKREELGFPLLKMENRWSAPPLQESVAMPATRTQPADVLLEVGVEEMPAQDVYDVLAQLRIASKTLLSELRLTGDSVKVYATPQRIVFSAKNVAPQQDDEEQFVKGPPADRAFDADGKPTKAAEGFARSKGITVDELTVQEIDGGEYVTATITGKGQSAISVLAEAFEKLIGDMKFQKTMRWNQTDISFSRPIRWIVALFGDAVIPFTYAGVASGKVTRGLRPYGSQDIALENPTDYFEQLAKQDIVLDYAERQQSIQQQIKKLADEVNGVIPDDQGLLDEVTNLIESPTALRGSFEEKYLDLPRDVLITVMRKHQRYFAVEDQDGSLMPYFIAVRNGDAEHLDKVTKGNEHVIRARFSDANFFYREDIKKPLKAHLPRLATLTFQEELGSMLDKNERVSELVEPVGDLLGLDGTHVAIAQRAAHIAKADLATQMVVEMTSLQGVMGREYALQQEYPTEVANAIFEHWLPRNAGDKLPQSPSGILLSLTDKMDSLVGLFAVGRAPKSNTDPYGLRRATLGIVQILLHHKMDVDLVQFINLVAMAQSVRVNPEIPAQVLEFIKGRLLALLIEEYDFARDVINAVISEQGSNPYRTVQGIEQLSQWVQRDNWEHILDNFARCIRITRSESNRYAVNPELFTEPQEKALYEVYEKAGQQEFDNVDGFLQTFVPMVPAIAEFFDNVLVHAEDKQVRNNRLGMLQAIGAMQNGYADLSELAGF